MPIFEVSTDYLKKEIHKIKQDLDYNKGNFCYGRIKKEQEELLDPDDVFIKRFESEYGLIINVNPAGYDLHIQTQKGNNTNTIKMAIAESDTAQIFGKKVCNTVMQRARNSQFRNIMPSSAIQNASNAKRCIDKYV